MSGKVSEVGDQNFEAEVLNSPVPVLVDFWAAWCAPCRMLAPVVEAIAEKYEGQAKVVKLNVDENTLTSGKYNIKGIPTLLLLIQSFWKDHSFPAFEYLIKKKFCYYFHSCNICDKYPGCDAGAIYH